jgi:hypothetical protein
VNTCCYPKSSIASDLFSRPGFGTRSSGDLLSSTFHAFPDIAGSISDRPKRVLRV